VVHVGEVDVRYRLPRQPAASRDRSENRRVLSRQLPFQSIHWKQAFPRASWPGQPSNGFAELLECATGCPQQALAALRDYRTRQLMKSRMF
jgi:hypothetical protein